MADPMEQIQLWLYHLDQFANHLVSAQLQHVSWITMGVILVAGLLTSLSPCMVSMLPITVGYIGGYSQQSRWQGMLQALWFALGLAITLTGLGLGAAFLGKVYGQTSGIWTILMSSVAIVMGLNVLEVLPLRFPSGLAGLDIPQTLPGRSFVLGLTFGLVASPCSTPVLVALLGWVSTSGNLWVGGSLLFAYALGLVFPLLLVGTFTALIKTVLSVRQWSRWLTYASGILLVAFGSLSLLTRFAI